MTAQPKEGQKPAGRRWRWAFGIGVGVVVALGLTFAMVRLMPIRERFFTDADTIKEPETRARTRDILWQPPRPLSEIINTTADDYEPRLSADGLTLFFVRGKAGHNSDIFVSHATVDGWTEPAPLTSVNSDYDDLGPEPSADGSALYFYSDRPGGYGGYDVWVAYLGGTGWRAPVNVGPAVNSEFNDYGPALTPDGETLYFSSNRPGPGDVGPNPNAWPATIREDLFHRDYDLYSASITERGIGQAAPLATLNTPFNEGAPAVSSFGDFLYFASDRPGGQGGFDLYRARRLRGALVQVDNLGPAVNTSANELDPGLSLGGYGLHFSSDRAVDVTAAAGEREYNLYYTTSREVFAETEARNRPPINWAAVWSAVGPSLLWLLLLLLLLLLFLAAMRGMAERRLGLLTKCLLASLFAHLLLLLLLTLWQVTTTLAGQFGRRGPIQVALAPSAQAGELSAQVRGGLTEVTTPAFEEIEFQRKEAEVPLQQVDSLATLTVDRPELDLTQTDTEVSVEPHDAKAAEMLDPRRVDLSVTQSEAPMPIAPDVPDEAKQSSAEESELEPTPSPDAQRIPDRPSVTAQPSLDVASAVAQVDVANANADSLPAEWQQTLVAPSRPRDASQVPQPVELPADAAAHADPAALPELALTVRASAPAAPASESTARPEIEIPQPSHRPAEVEPSKKAEPTILVDAAMPPITMEQSESTAPPIDVATVRDSEAESPTMAAAEGWLDATSLELPESPLPNVPTGTMTADARAQTEAVFEPGRQFVAEEHEARAEELPELSSDTRTPHIEEMAPERVESHTQPSFVRPEAQRATEVSALPSSIAQPTTAADEALSGIPLPAADLVVATPGEVSPTDATPETDVAVTPSEVAATRAETNLESTAGSTKAPQVVELSPTEADSPTTDTNLLAMAPVDARDARIPEPAMELHGVDSNRLVATSLSTELPLTDSLGLPDDEMAPDNPYLLRDTENKLSLVERMGGSAETERAVALALAWLARHQSDDGHWDGDDFDDACGECGGETDITADTALTGLATLCFLGAGHTHLTDGPYRDTVRRSLRWLVEHEEPNGDLRNGETMYSHGIASIALSESYAMTKDSTLKTPVQRAIGFIAKARHSRAGGWRYDPGQLGDTSVLGWQIMALKSARIGGLYVAPDLFETGRLWLDTVSRRSRGLYAYTPDRSPTPSMTAEGMFVQQLLGLKRGDPRMQESAEFLMRHLPDWDTDPSTYFWYYASLALFQHQGEEWTRWNEALTRELLAHQRKDGGAAGSWDPADRWSTLGGRVYQTALCTLMLEVYYRYLPLYTLDGIPVAGAPEAEAGTVFGRVTDRETGAPLLDATVRLDLSERPSVIATTDDAGRYRLDAADVPEHFALSASQEGYLPDTADIEAAMLERGPLALDFDLEPIRDDAVAIEAVPDVHHLGDNRFDGRINSQFQKESEGASFEAEFELTEAQLEANADHAEVRLMAKGVQRSHRLLINGTELDERLDDAPSDGSFGEFVATFDKSLLRAGANTFAVIAAPSTSDIDDFEFVNVQIRLVP